jgi:hypothetical protein
MTSPRPARTRSKATPPADQAEDNTSKGNPLFLPPADPPAPLPQGLPPHLQPANPAEINYAPPSSMSDPSGDGPVVGSPSVTPSTDKAPAPPKVTRGNIRKYAKMLIVAAGKYAQQRLTEPDSIERQAGLFMPDDEDVTDIADPVAGLVSRRMPSRAGGVVGNPDIEDGFVLVVAIVAYVMKQVEQRQRLRQLYAQVTPDLTANDVEAVPA